MKTPEFVDDIINKYYMIINEYIHHMIESEVLKTMDNSNYIVCIGLNVIIYIFQISIYSLKNIDAVYTVCQNAYYCYLEYIEQMHKTDTLHDLMNIDAILFVYKRAFDTASLTTNNIQTTLNNLILSNGTNNGITHAMNHLCMITKTVLFYNPEFAYNSSDHKYSQNITISEIEYIITHYLYKYLQLLTYCCNNDNKLIDNTVICSYMQYIQEKTNMNYSDYISYLNELYKILKKNKKYSIEITSVQTNEKIIDQFLNKENCQFIMDTIVKKDYKLLTKKLFNMDGDSKEV